jgi:hypothetical protein
MTEKLFQMKISAVPYSSVVGSGLMVVADGVGVVAQLAIMVPQPHLDYKMVAEAVSKALLSHGTSKGNITLVLPETFVDDAQKAVAASRAKFDAAR